MKNKFSILLLALLLTQHLSAQRSYSITYRESLPRIDGQLEPAYWQNMPVMDSFTTTLPYFSREPQGATQAYMVYTPKGICVGAICHSSFVRDEGSFRDQLGSGDWFRVGLDTWNDDQNAFVFTVNAFGQRIDTRNSSTDQRTDFDAVWQVKTTVMADGWTLEMFIPFTALRFPKGSSQDWGIQCTRYDRTTGETTTWNPQDPLTQDVVLQYGNLTGLHDVRQKMRLAMTAYGNTAYETFYDSRFPSGFYADASWANIGGLDGRVGIGSNSTLDFSVLPSISRSDGELQWGGTSSLPRQLYEEEQAIFTKSMPFIEQLPVSTFDLLPYFLNFDPSSFSIIPKRSAYPMSSVKFTGRYKHGIGAFASSTVHSRPIGNWFFRPSEVKFPHNPIQSTFGVEKLLRNNSWVQLSGNLLHFGFKEINNQKGNLAWQLRDKQNLFEFKGQFNTQHQNGFSVGEGIGSLGKVNGKWTYGIEGQTAHKTRHGLLLSSIPSLSPDLLYSVRGHITRRNFSPKHPYWLNTACFIKGSQSKFTASLPNSGPLMSLGARGLNKRFQTIEGGLTIRPLDNQVWVDFGDTRLYQKVRAPMGPFAAFKTDERKNAWVEARAGTHFILQGGTGYDVNLNASTFFRVKRIFVMGAAMSYLFDSYESKASPLVTNDRVAEVFKREAYSLSGFFQYSPKRWLVCDVSLGIARAAELARTMYTVDPSGVVPYPFTFEYNPKVNTDLWLRMRTDLLLNANSIFRITLDTQNSEGINTITSFFPAVVSEEFSAYRFLKWNFAFVYNLTRV